MVAAKEISQAQSYRTSAIVDSCQICERNCLVPILFLGYMPPVNKMRKVHDCLNEQPSYPTQLLWCPDCDLVQLGLSIDPKILFPPEYPYTSGVTRILRDNFVDLYREAIEIYPLTLTDLVVDIGSNDGTLLSNFHAGGHKVLGVEPTDVGELARQRGINTLRSFFTRDIARKILNENGPAKIITAANVFAHIENIHSVVEGIVDLLSVDGIFISESHYLINLIDTLQYDTVYHEHLRYYSLHSLKKLLSIHGLEIFHAHPIRTHGGSIRVFAARMNRYKIFDSVSMMLQSEPSKDQLRQRLLQFKQDVLLSKLKLLSIIEKIKTRNERIFAVGAPSRASTLINYVGLDDGIIDCIVEVSGSLKIGKYLPGTMIPIFEEDKLFNEQPEYALILSWHIADELMLSLRKKGYKGKFIIPLPYPHIIK